MVSVAETSDKPVPSREAQGLPATITDPAVLARVVALLIGGKPLNP